jgi:rubrerythrin
MEKTNILEALGLAIRAEEQAEAFYAAAAEKTDDAGGKEMFRELAEFECHHKERLTQLRESLQAGGGFLRYEGRSLSKVPGAEARGRPAVGDHADALEALRLAIAAEEKAEAEYRNLARAADDEAGRRMFEKLAEEESMHRKLLDDQCYALANKGLWLWGD